jgi:hypothetical protein
MEKKPRSAFPTGSGRITTVCHECREKEREAYKTKVCTHCNQPVPRELFLTNQHKVCEPCRASEKAQRNARNLVYRPADQVIEGVLSRWCKKCSSWKELDEHFYKGKKEQTCKDCKKKAVAAYKRIPKEPWVIERTKQKRRAWQREYRKKNAARIKAASARRRAAIKADPKRHAEFLENQRISYRLSRERAGKPVREADITKKVKGGWQNPGGRVSTDPISHWIEAVVAKEVPASDVSDRTVEDLAHDLGVDARSLWRVRHREHSTISRMVVEKLIVRYGLPVFMSAADIEGRLEKWARSQPGNGTRLLRYMDRAEKLVHLADVVVECPQDVYPELDDE